MKKGCALYSLVRVSEGLYHVGLVGHHPCRFRVISYTGPQLKNNMMVMVVNGRIPYGLHGPRKGLCLQEERRHFPISRMC